jgi:hypothetical protein
MASSGSTALLSDYNNPQSTITNVFGNGSGNRGYGQTTIFSSAYSTSTVISANDWNNLRYDAFNARAHQIGTYEAITIAAAQGSSIAATDANTFASYASTVDTNRLTAHVSRISTASLGTITRTSPWSTSVQAQINQTFANYDQARYFYNTGGNVQFTSSRSGGDVSAQNTSWTNLLSAAGTFVFNQSHFYGLSGSYGTVYSTAPSSPYASNLYIIEAQLSGATVIFKITYVDAYTDPAPGNLPLPEDIVNGTLSLSLSHQYATGGAALAGGGNFKGFGGAYAGNYEVVYASSVSITGG